MDDFRQFMEGIAVPLVMAIFGGVTRVFRDGFRSWRHFAGAMFVSGFAGVVVHLLIADLPVSATTKAAIVAISGYSGGMMLDILTSRVQRGAETIGLAGKWDGEERRKDDRGRDDGS